LNLPYSIAYLTVHEDDDSSITEKFNSDKRKEAMKRLISIIKSPATQILLTIDNPHVSVKKFSDFLCSYAVLLQLIHSVRWNPKFQIPTSLHAINRRLALYLFIIVLIVYNFKHVFATCMTQIKFYHSKAVSFSHLNVDHNNSGTGILQFHKGIVRDKTGIRILQFKCCILTNIFRI
jgi:hypothetical protein